MCKYNSSYKERVIMPEKSGEEFLKEGNSKKKGYEK